VERAIFFPGWGLGDEHGCVGWDMVFISTDGMWMKIHPPGGGSPQGGWAFKRKLNFLHVKFTN